MDNKKSALLKSVKMFKTSDGAIFEKEPDAKRYEANLGMRADLLDFFGQFYFSGLTKSELVDEVVNRLDELKSIINFKGSA